ncbi:DNA polymerase III subunit beta [Candidatus Roizmanbacteria bacterium]|nr:DNA polymerase III subunit beta [Candidatus Roizmanbacteria bacterium]
MKILLEKNSFIKKVSLASHFCSGKISTSPSLQGVLMKGNKDRIDFYSSNLNNFFHTSLKTSIEKEFSILVEPKKIIEYLNYLPESKVEFEVGEKQLMVSSGKNKGTFPIMDYSDFPLPPEIKDKKQKIKTKFLKDNLPMIIFSTAHDESRPSLTGINFITNDDLTMVTTDGFRLSLVKTEKQADWPSFIIPAVFFDEVYKIISEEESVDFTYSSDEKLIYLQVGENDFYSRLIDGEFPPFERVIPEKTVTKVILDKEEFLRGVKQVSVFARELSSVILLNFSKEGLIIKPKSEEGKNETFVETKMEGDEQKIAFNYKFLTDFLTRVVEKNIMVEILRPDAPVVFKIKGRDNYLHLIMPVRIQE